MLNTPSYFISFPQLFSSIQLNISTHVRSSIFITINNNISFTFHLFSRILHIILKLETCSLLYINVLRKKLAARLPCFILAINMIKLPCFNAEEIWQFDIVYSFAEVCCNSWDFNFNSGFRQFFWFLFFIRAFYHSALQNVVGQLSFYFINSLPCYHWL